MAELAQCLNELPAGLFTVLDVAWKGIIGTLALLGVYMLIILALTRE